MSEVPRAGSEAGASTGASVRPLRIGIVGGGAAGTLVAVNLLREFEVPTEILLIEKSGEFGPGIPYRTKNPEHRLNVPAIRMSALVDEPSHFFAWLRRRDPDATEASYATGSDYGDYLCDLLADAETSCPEHLGLTRVVGEVTDARLSAEVVDATRDSVGAVAVTIDGAEHEVDHLVIATGPVSGGDPVPVPDSLRERGIYIPDSWDEESVLPALRDQKVLIIGTGLTMVDVALSLGSRPAGPRIRAISRNGLVPKPHRNGLTSTATPSLSSEGEVRINDLLGAFATELLRAGAEGWGWRDAIDSMRSVTPSAWRRLPREDRLWFIQNLNRFWEVHRYRIAPRVATAFDRLRSSGRLSVQAARIGSIEDSDGKARVTLLTAAGTEIAEFDRVISCCGASTSVSRDAPQPIRSLIASGAIRPDDIDLGLDTDRDGAIRDAGGNRSPFFSTLGSLRRGVEWETIGVTELRWQSAEIARRLATELRQNNPAELGQDNSGLGQGNPAGTSRTTE